VARPPSPARVVVASLGLPVALNKSADVHCLLRDATLAQVLDATDSQGLAWAYRLVMQDVAPAGWA